MHLKQLLERKIVITERRGLSLKSCFHAAQETNGARHMIKYQEGFLIAKNLVVMSETSVVADIVERFQCRNAPFQDAHCHFGLNVATIA